MAHKALRVLAKFQWGGWWFAPRGACRCGCPGCLGEVAVSCPCSDQKRQRACHCACGIAPGVYGGDVLLVEENHPRLEWIVNLHKAVYDISLDAEKLATDKEFSRLLKPPRARAAAVR